MSAEHFIGCEAIHQECAEKLRLIRVSRTKLAKKESASALAAPARPADIYVGDALADALDIIVGRTRQLPTSEHLRALYGLTVRTKHAIAEYFEERPHHCRDSSDCVACELESVLAEMLKAGL